MPQPPSGATEAELDELYGQRPSAGPLSDLELFLAPVRGLTGALSAYEVPWEQLPQSVVNAAWGAWDRFFEPDGQPAHHEEAPGQRAQLWL